MVGPKPPPGFRQNTDKCAFSASCPPPADVSKLMSFEYVHLFVEVLRLVKNIVYFLCFSATFAGGKSSIQNSEKSCSFSGCAQTKTGYNKGIVILL